MADVEPAPTEPVPPNTEAGLAPRLRQRRVDVRG
jgi:hypothetical protein